MNDTPFISYAHRYIENQEASQRTYARAGMFETPAGTYEPAVILFRNRFCLAVLTPEDAVRISNELIDHTERPVT